MPRPTLSADARAAALCAALPLVAAAAALPGAEAGIIDDFSYVHMARTLADTGRFAYDGWSTAMVGALVTWRPKNSLAAFASAKTEVLKTSSTAALANESGVMIVISTRVDAA